MFLILIVLVFGNENMIISVRFIEYLIKFYFLKVKFVVKVKFFFVINDYFVISNDLGILKIINGLYNLVFYLFDFLNSFF